MNEAIVLVTLDGSPLAEAALPYSAAVASAFGARLVLLGVLEPQPPNDLLEVRASIDVQQRYRTYLDKLAAGLKGKGLAVEVNLRAGRPAEQILEAIEQLQPKLLVMSTHGRSGITRWFYGSVASRLTRETPVPTLFIGPHARERAARPEPIGRILVPLDGSPLAESALTTAEELANALGAQLLLVEAVWTGTQNFVWDIPIDTIGQIENELAKAAEEYLARTAAGFHTQTPATTKVLHSQPADALTDFVARERIDLVVMTSHCRAGVSRMVLGSVADRMLQCGAPVLLVRPNAQQAEPQAFATAAYA